MNIKYVISVITYRKNFVIAGKFIAQVGAEVCL